MITRQDTKYHIIDNTPIGTNTMMMTLAGPTSTFTAPGQFVNIAIPGFTLRRPISVCSIEENQLTIVYDKVGAGTEVLDTLGPKTEVDLLPALGNGFDLSKCGERPVLLAGGVGCPPIYNLAKELIKKGVLPTVVLGFNSSDRMIMIEAFEKLYIPFHVATIDGSYGIKGYVTDVLKHEAIDPDYFYACGPLPMLKSLCQNLDIPGEVSLESRMACGFGVCMCCSLETKKGPRRICKDGPVFDKEDLIWK